MKNQEGMSKDTSQVLLELKAIQDKISKSESESIMDRWEFGRVLLAQMPEGKKQLPKNLRADITQHYGLEASEITRRMQLAKKFATHEQVVDACAHCGGSWRRIIREELTKKPRGEKRTDWGASKKATLDRWLTEVNGDDEHHAELKQLITQTARALGLNVAEAQS